MKRTISVEVGKGSVNHNSRKFKAENVDGARSHLNIDYCNERIQDVYQMLFGPAQERFNARQKRADRRIPNYYEKICTGHQEKPFHEIIIQIGNKDDMSALGENAELAKTVLNEYYQGFQARNPNLYVFSAHLHMDEETPHLHIDFVPFITGSKRGLDTRVSLKQALAAQGFKGGTRSDTEWNQWVRSKKLTLLLRWRGTVSNGSRKAPMTSILLCLITRSRSAAVRCSSLARRLMNADARFIIFSSRQRNISRRWRIAN